jgi:hypothetical protein
MIMVLGTHFTRASDVIVPDYLTTTPAVSITPYRDLFGNWCSRIVAPDCLRHAASGDRWTAEIAGPRHLTYDFIWPISATIASRFSLSGA